MGPVGSVVLGGAGVLLVLGVLVMAAWLLAR